MAALVVVPRLGWTMEEGVFTEWLKKDGDAVREGEPLFLLEGEKSVEEIPAVDAGILRIPPDAPKPGDVVKVGATVAYLAGVDEPTPWESRSAPVAAPSAPAAVSTPALTPTPVAEPTTVKFSYAPGLRARRIALDHGSPEPAPSDPSAPGMEPRISPRARRIARELGVDWRSLVGTGRTGRVRERDVREAHLQSAASPSAVAGKFAPLTPMRKTIARRMCAGVHEAAPVTLFSAVDATRLAALRREFKAAAQTGDGFAPTITDLLVKLTAQALAEHPNLNAQWRPEGIFHPDGVHIGVAVDTEAGLLVPVLRNAVGLTLREIAGESKRLAESARARRLKAEDLDGGTFTISNLGMFGVDGFTPILHLPQAAILGVGRITVEPAVVDGRIEPREKMTLSLTFDHRVVDGAPAARFLDSLRRRIEQPSAHLLS